jgi:hypothetical protein
MKPRSQNLGVKEVSQRHPVVHNSLLKHISVATNMHTAAEYMLGAVFSDKSNTKLYKEGQRDPEKDYSQSLSPVGLGTKNDCGGDSQQRFTQPADHSQTGVSLTTQSKS